MTTTTSRRLRRVSAATLAGAFLLAASARAGFPTFDIAAFGQRVQNAITSNAQLAAIGSLVTNTSTMLTTLNGQLDQALNFAEGQIGALSNWTQMFPSVSAHGAPGQVQGWISRIGQLRTRGEDLASGALAALPTEGAIRGAWAAAPASVPIGTPPVPVPAESRADLDARIARERAAVLARFDAVAAERGAAAERTALALADIRQTLDDVAADPAVSSTALAQKHISATTAGSDLLAAQLQVVALREEQAIEEAATRREALAGHQAAIVAGIEAAFVGTDTIMARFDAAAADQAWQAPTLPVY